ncbi:hypothetical protein AgCh_003960 [Apium graveolens]
MTIPVEERPKYRNRRDEITTNVLAACSPNLLFQYVLTGWEGSAADGRVLRDAIHRHGLIIPGGTYYLIDAKNSNGEGYLAPYRGLKYHLNDWDDENGPTSAREYFNMRHSMARNVVERTEMSFAQDEIEFDEEGSEDENEPQNEHEFVGEHITTIGMESRVDTVERGVGKNKRKWTENEDGTLIESLLELVNNGACKVDNGFKSGYLDFLESSLNTKIPASGLKGKPHIEYRLKTLKKDFTAV